MPVIACCEAHDTTGTVQFVKTSDAYLERRAQQRRSASPARIMGRRDDHHQLEEGCELMHRLGASINRRGASRTIDAATCGDDVVPVAVHGRGHARDADDVLAVTRTRASTRSPSAAARRPACSELRPRRKLWIKGETSGDVLDLVEIRVNCEQNSALYLVKPRRTGACHTRGPDGRTRRSCFYRALEGDAWLVKRPSPKS